MKFPPKAIAPNSWSDPPESTVTAPRVLKLAKATFPLVCTVAEDPDPTTILPPVWVRLVRLPRLPTLPAKVKVWLAPAPIMAKALSRPTTTSLAKAKLPEPPRATAPPLRVAPWLNLVLVLATWASNVIPLNST